MFDVKLIFCQILYFNFFCLFLKVFKSPEDFAKEEPHENLKQEIEGRLKKEFDQMVKWNPKITLDNLKVMAQKNNFTSGKWLLSVPWDRADEQWDILKRALVTGKLPVIIFFHLSSIKRLKVL